MKPPTRKQGILAIAPGTRLGHYDIRSRLGAGGMGEVYLADDTSLHRQVAIKVLLADTAANDHAQRRLLREAQAAATLDHPNICGIYEVGDAGGRHFIVMQYVEGETLAARLARAPLALPDTLSIASQIADALAEAHARGILHRDIKPQNVMVTPRGQAKLMDFGLATRGADTSPGTSDAETESNLTTPGAIMGTIKYMSPEQVQGHPLDARSDIFSFGVMLYEMASGHHPFAGENPATTISAILTRTPEPVARFANLTPAELDRIITKAIAKEKGQRYQSIKELVIDLQSLGKRPEGRARPARIVRYALPTVGVALVLATMYFGVVARPRAAILSDKDTILLADWENTTGDPVLDGALKTALAVQLEQSPFLSLFSDERVRETLRYMGKPDNTRVTKAVAREICQRQGLKVLIAGSVAPLGSQYVLTLEAIDGHTGEVLVPEQEQAASKEQLLRSLGQAAVKLRERLGESLGSIQKYDAPIEEATTTSLEALQAFSLALGAQDKGDHAEAIRQGNRAVGLDPNFARAFALLAVSHFNSDCACAPWGEGESGLTIEAARKAYDLRERVSPRERLYITYWYHRVVTMEADKATEVLETLTRTYPRFARAGNNLAFQYIDAGQDERGLAEYRRALAANPSALVYGNLAGSLEGLNHFDEARDVCQQALDRKFDVPFCHGALFDVAFVKGDSAAMAQQVAWGKATPGESWYLQWQAETATFAGQARRARALSAQAASAAERAGQRALAGGHRAMQAATDASFGDCGPAKENAAKSIALTTAGLQYIVAVTALVLCGDTHRAEGFDAVQLEKFPDTMHNALVRPWFRALVARSRGDEPRARRLFESEGVRKYERSWGPWLSYERGVTDLNLRDGKSAAAEFQAVLDHRGWWPRSWMNSLAHLGLARALVLTGHIPDAIKAYDAFFELWKDADVDVPVLVEAKREYGRLQK